ncbi:hypothetical protein PRUPE_I003100 [Prunus persica]|uniref:Beta'-coat protein n=1 Tax=Prunus persica TaxID=3760 RepID=A0A1R3L534_PRUPE|nr:hypothetical protein PRUPE_I003100 [Prunus persica]
MPFSLTIEKEFAQNSERVKSVDQHPTEPWILVSLYSGTLCIWNYQSQTMEKSFKVTESPVRSAKFIARENWIVTAADDKYIRIYNYDTMEKIKEYEAHTDYIRSVAVHPTLPYLLSCSDDKVIKLWDWEKDWSCTQILEGHSHYVMQVAFNPKDTNTFASASLDGTIKIWNIGSPKAEFTLDGHSNGVNCIDYFSCGDKPYLLSGSDDSTAKVWDQVLVISFLFSSICTAYDYGAYMCHTNLNFICKLFWQQVWDIETKSCVQTLEGHEHNVTAVCVHAELPIIITVSEDGNIHIWNATTFRLENKLNYGLERVWAIGQLKGSNKVAFGFDKGTIVVKMNGSHTWDSVDLQA